MLHDLNQAATYSDRMVALQSGEVVTEGTPAEVMTSQTLREVFGMEMVILSHPMSGLPVCLPCDLECKGAEGWRGRGEKN